MKILVIAWFFPPTNTIAAVRLGRLCDYLHAQGHDVRVVSARGLPYQQNLHRGMSGDKIRYTDWIDVPRLPNKILDPLMAFIQRLRRQNSGSNETARTSTAPSQRGKATSLHGRLLRWVKDSISGVLAMPDKQIGWLPYAVSGGKDLLRDWPVDLVYASGPPFTTLVIGYQLARKAGVPWVAELRDRWSDDPYYPPLPWLHFFHRKMETFLLRRAAGIVTVSEPWAKTYRATYGKPVQIVYNGYDPDAATPTAPAPEPARGAQKDILRIVYTGGIYPGRRDPAPLFAALKLMPEDAACIRIDFFGTKPYLVEPLAKSLGLEDVITVHPPLSHDLAIAEQRRADVLLLMQWNNPKEQGNVPGKFFEYLGARRPILLLGLKDGVPASLLKERGAGVCANEPEEIARELRTWLTEKRQNGVIAQLPQDAREGFARDQQYAKLEPFIRGLRRAHTERVK